MRLIDADELIKMLQDTIDFNMKHNTFFKSFSMQHMLYILENMKTIDPVKHGHWVDTGRADYYLNKEYRCSCCDSVDYLRSPYCYNCGARMDGEQNVPGD